MGDHRIRAAGYGLAGAALTATTLVFALLAGVDWATFVDTYTLTNLVIGLGFLLPGVTIRWFHARNRLGTLLIIGGLGALGTPCAAMLLQYGLGHDWPTVTLRVLADVFIGAWQLGIGLCFGLAILLFPTGRLPSPRWRIVLALTIASGVYQLGTGMVSSAQLFGDPRAVPILSVGINVEGTTYNAVMGWLAGLLELAQMASLVVRYRGGTEKVKRQILWLLLALIVFLLFNVQRFFLGEGAILLLLSAVVVPIAIGVAIIRYELFDIRLVLSRTVVYTATVAVIVAAYAALVAVLSLVISEQSRRGVPVSAALIVAFAFNPVRLRVQSLVDRAFYGGRADPAGTAREIAVGLSQLDELTEVLERTRDALRLPWMALDQADGTRLAEAGSRSSGTETTIDLGYRGSTVGTLHLQLRRGENVLHEADRGTLELICTPLAIALHATALSGQVRQARAAMVEAAAAERVRLQRELHDGLGPTLTSIAFRVDAAANTVRADAETAGRLMREIGTDIRDAIDGVRRIVYGLRPIELDDLGLVGAIRQHVAAEPTSDDGNKVTIELHTPETPLGLSPAVELAAYRIVMESITNVLRHSTARTCTVTVAVNGRLDLTIADDGTPPRTWHPGIGIPSLRDRAEELGGTACAGPVDGGWTVHAELPLSR
jgi:signal transduction histidine kinase